MRSTEKKLFVITSERVRTVHKSTAPATGNVMASNTKLPQARLRQSCHWGQKDAVGDIDQHRQINARDHKAYKRIFIRIVAHYLS